MRHRTPRPRPLSLFCVNTAGACVLLTLALAASTGVHAQSVAPVSEAPADLGEGRGAYSNWRCRFVKWPLCAKEGWGANSRT